MSNCLDIRWFRFDHRNTDAALAEDWAIFVKEFEGVEDLLGDMYSPGVGDKDGAEDTAHQGNSAEHILCLLDDRRMEGWSGGCREGVVLGIH